MICLVIMNHPLRSLDLCISGYGAFVLKSAAQDTRQLLAGLLAQIEALHHPCLGNGLASLSMVLHNYLVQGPLIIMIGKIYCSCHYQHICHSFFEVLVAAKNSKLEQWQLRICLKAVCDMYMLSYLCASSFPQDFEIFFFIFGIVMPPLRELEHCSGDTLVEQLAVVSLCSHRHRYSLCSAMQHIQRNIETKEIDETCKEILDKTCKQQHTSCLFPSSLSFLSVLGCPAQILFSCYLSCFIKELSVLVTAATNGCRFARFPSQ